MSSDQDNANDSFTSSVTHLNANDIGVSEINSPSSGTNLSSAEQVIVTITNYGGATQYNFDVSVDIDGTIITACTSEHFLSKLLIMGNRNANVLPVPVGESNTT